MVLAAIRHFELPESTRDVLLGDPGILHSIRLFCVRSTTTSSSHSALLFAKQTSSEGIFLTSTSGVFAGVLHTKLFTVFEQILSTTLLATTLVCLSTTLSTILEFCTTIFLVFEFWRLFADCASLN